MSFPGCTHLPYIYIMYIIQHIQFCHFHLENNTFCSYTNLCRNVQLKYLQKHRSGATSGNETRIKQGRGVGKHTMNSSSLGPLISERSESILI